MIFSLGHSTLPSDDFAAVCQEAGVKRIIDVRSHPGSNANPQHGRAKMQKWLAVAGIGYEWWPGLGGWEDRHRDLASRYIDKDVDILAYCNNVFPRQRISKPCPYGFSCYGFHDFQYFQTIGEYDQAILDLIARKDEALCMICCEARFVMCHRAMLADNLAIHGIEVMHIEPRFRKVKKPRVVVKLTGHGKFVSDRLPRYDQAVIRHWQSQT